MLTKFLTSSTIRLNVSAEDWRDAITKGGELLVAAEIVEESYIAAMLDAADEYGPYFVLTPGCALPHARPMDGVLQQGMSMITLCEPVHFMDSANNPVKVVICLAALDNSSHLEGLQQLAVLLENDQDVDAVLDATDVDEVLTILSKYG